jgi:hypothetical protein
MTGTTASSSGSRGRQKMFSTGAGPLESAQLLFWVLSAGVDDRHNCRAMAAAETDEEDTDEFMTVESTGSSWVLYSALDDWHTCKSDSRTSQHARTGQKQVRFITIKTHPFSSGQSRVHPDPNPKKEV